MSERGDRDIWAPPGSAAGAPDPDPAVGEPPAQYLVPDAGQALEAWIAQRFPEPTLEERRRARSRRNRLGLAVIVLLVAACVAVVTLGPSEAGSGPWSALRRCVDVAGIVAAGIVLVVSLTAVVVIRRPRPVAVGERLAVRLLGPGERLRVRALLRRRPVDVPPDDLPALDAVALAWAAERWTVLILAPLAGLQLATDLSAPDTSSFTVIRPVVYPVLAVTLLTAMPRLVAAAGWLRRRRP